MRESKRAARIASLEAARAELEATLSDNAQWQALVAEPDQANLEREHELADNPLYRAWRAVNAAIESLRAHDSGTLSEETLGLADNAASVASTPQEQHGEPPDDLTRIKGIDAETAGALARLGITRYAQIAAWRRDDVRTVSQTLGLTREISRQNWIEQAALLARREHDQRRHEEQVRERDIDLPDILEAIRRDASALGSVQLSAVAHHGGPAASEEPASVDTEAAPVLAQAPVESLPAAAALNGEPFPVVPPTEATLPSASQASRIPTVAASAHVNTDAAERARRLEQERRRLRNAGHGPEDDEATVTFVIREPVAAAADDATMQGSASLRRAQDQPRRGADRMESYAPHETLAEEAQVVLVKKGGGHQGGDNGIYPPETAGSVHRLLRSLRRS